ncbi:MAG: DsbA family protein [Bacteroidota bacterium]
MKLFFRKKIKVDLGLLLAIVFASVVISGSLVFFAMTLSGSGSMNNDVFQQRIEDGIDKYIQRKTQEAQDQQDSQVAAQAEASKSMAKNVSEVSLSDDHIFGNKDAKISIVEYSDFQCAYCRSFHSTAKQIIDTYKGEVNWVYRHYPLSFHEPAASHQAVASECVAELGGNDKFWEFADILFTSGPSDEESLGAAVAGLGIDRDAFKKCLGSGKFDQKIRSNSDNGSASGVTGTPGSIVINNETGDAVLIKGAQGLSAFQKVIDPMLSS